MVDLADPKGSLRKRLLPSGMEAFLVGAVIVANG
jgi:hypothetical protein